MRRKKAALRVVPDKKEIEEPEETEEFFPEEETEEIPEEPEETETPKKRERKEKQQDISSILENHEERLRNIESWIFRVSVK